MSRSALLAATSLLLVLAAGVTWADEETDDGGFTSLDSVERGRGESLDAADDGATSSLDAVDGGRTESLDREDTGRSDSLDAADAGRSDSLDAADQGVTRSLDRAETERGPWQPPACSGLQVDVAPVPDGSDPEAWRDRLQQAEVDLAAARTGLEQADAALSEALSFHRVGAPRAAAVQARDDARRRYGQARCALPALVEQARRAGVAPGVLRTVAPAPADAP